MIEYMPKYVPITAEVCAPLVLGRIDVQTNTGENVVLASDDRDYRPVHNVRVALSKISLAQCFFSFCKWVHDLFG